MYSKNKARKLRMASSSSYRNKLIERSRSKYNPIARRYFGKSITAKLSRVTSGNITSVSDWDTVYGLANVLSTSPDWPFYRDSYGMMNILSVTVKLYPQGFASQAGIDRTCGICYDVKDNTPLSSLQAVVDHKQHMLINNGVCGKDHYVFKTKCKPINITPISTGTLQESWGWIKAYADNGDFGSTNISIVKLEFIFTVAFSSEQ